MTADVRVVARTVPAHHGYRAAGGRDLQDVLATDFLAPELLLLLRCVRRNLLRGPGQAQRVLPVNRPEPGGGIRTAAVIQRRSLPIGQVHDRYRAVIAFRANGDS